MFADVLQLPIEVTAIEELGAMGAAMCAAIGVGLFKSYQEAVSRMVRVARTVYPCEENVAVYKKKYARYQRCVSAMQSATD
jgi:L-xylulokinase